MYVSHLLNQKYLKVYNVIPILMQMVIKSKIKYSRYVNTVFQKTIKIRKTKTFQKIHGWNATE